MYKYVLIFLMIIGLFSCAEPEEKKKSNQIVWQPEDTIDMVKGWSKDEQFLIDQYVSNNNWEMITTETGLRYMIYERNELEVDSIAKRGQIAWVQFEIAPLNDTVVYRSEKDIAESFVIEMDHVENGLHEAITYMRKGDRAKIILPQHLAHGLLGDDLKIPPLTAVVYDIKLVDLE
ncbi:MAG: FKBP-type peptidyl-prolyl cis-trans isomerase FkpA [Parvicellaceae bacterium]|jgi:FKBP-type peptidyl-prolyl cis-trans isomerase FkpA